MVMVGPSFTFLVLPSYVTELLLCYILKCYCLLAFLSAYLFVCMPVCLLRYISIKSLLTLVMMGGGGLYVPLPILYLFFN